MRHFMSHGNAIILRAEGGEIFQEQGRHVGCLSRIWEEIVGRNKSAPDTLLRQWHMLREVPRYPHKIAVSELRGRLEAAGFDVTARTSERDLNELSEAFPLPSDDRERPFGWSWQKDAPAFDLPNLSN